jgi:hypothetical protein
MIKQIFAAGFCIAAVSACSGAGSGTVSLGTSAQCVEQPSCCDSSGNYNASLCTTAAGAPSLQAASQASKAAQSVADAGTNSSNGAQTASGDASGKTLSEAATAQLGTAPSGPNAATELASVAANPTPLTSTGSGSAGSPAGSSSGGSNLSGSTVTASVADAPTSGTSPVSLDEGVGGAESIGNVGRAGGHGGDNGSSNPFGSLMDAFGGGKQTAARAPAEINFKGEVDPLTGKPTSGTTDPSDYFSRLTSNDNLFKVVEHRYQQQAMTWAKQN